MKYKNSNSQVDAYIKTLPTWQQDICRQVRDLIHQAEPEIVETIKRTNRPYFTLQGNICALLGTKDHVTIFIYDPIASDPKHIINQGHENLTARAIQIYEGEKIDEDAFMDLIQAVAADNRAGGWRKLKKSH